MARKPGQLGMTPALKRVYDFLIAATGEPCPSNSEIALALGIIEEATVSQRIASLIKRGFILSNYRGGGRVITIVASGAKTVRGTARIRKRVAVHRVNNKRVRDRLARIQEEGDEETTPEPDILGMVKWGRDWERDLDEAELWLSRAMADLEDDAA